MSQNKPPFYATRIPQWEPLSARLRETLLALSASVPDRGTNKASGQSFFQNKWLSDRRLHLDGPPVFRELGSEIEKIANKVVQRREEDHLLSVSAMWSVISKTGMTGERHGHSGSVSSVYYVDPGTSGAEHGGLIQFYADRSQSAPSHAITPEPGMLVIFPSHLEHSVTRYDSEAQRIVVSANLSWRQRR